MTFRIKLQITRSTICCNLELRFRINSIDLFVATLLFLFLFSFSFCFLFLDD